MCQSDRQRRERTDGRLRYPERESQFTKDMQQPAGRTAETMMEPINTCETVLNVDHLLVRFIIFIMQFWSKVVLDAFSEKHKSTVTLLLTAGDYLL